MTDRIALTGLRARGNHGVLDHERRDGQEFAVDITLWADLRAPGASDALVDTVDYGALAERAVAVLTGPPCALLETVAARIAAEALADERVLATKVTVHKPGAPIPHAFDDVAVTVHRRRA